MSVRPRRLFGHRGASSERPENTMISFERAMAIGVDVLETDVHMTSDGHIVVSHDDNGVRSAGVVARIDQSTLAQVRSWDAGYGFVDADGNRPFAGCGIGIPTLAELLEASGNVHLNIDLKPPDPSVVGAVMRLLREHRAEHRVTLASFHTRVIREVRRSGFRGETVLSRDEALALIGLPRPLCRPFLGGGDAVQLPLRVGPIDLSSRSFIDDCHALGLRVDYWTVNDPVVADVLLDRGADGIMTDDPAALAPVFARYR